jgi:hypothetical protein
LRKNLQREGLFSNLHNESPATKLATMLTDMGPSAGQFYGAQIPTMGMNITNIATHMQKPAVSTSDLCTSAFFLLLCSKTWQYAGAV